MPSKNNLTAVEKSLPNVFAVLNKLIQNRQLLKDGCDELVKIRQDIDTLKYTTVKSAINDLDALDQRYKAVDAEFKKNFHRYSIDDTPFKSTHASPSAMNESSIPEITTDIRKNVQQWDNIEKDPTYAYFAGLQSNMFDLLKLQPKEDNDQSFIRVYKSGFDAVVEYDTISGQNGNLTSLKNNIKKITIRDISRVIEKNLAGAFALYRNLNSVKIDDYRKKYKKIFDDLDYYNTKSKNELQPAIDSLKNKQKPDANDLKEAEERADYCKRRIVTINDWHADYSSVKGYTQEYQKIKDLLTKNMNSFQVIASNISAQLSATASGLSYDTKFRENEQRAGVLNDTNFDDINSDGTGTKIDFDLFEEFKRIYNVQARTFDGLKAKYGQQKNTSITQVDVQNLGNTYRTIFLKIQKHAKKIEDKKQYISLIDAYIIKCAADLGSTDVNKLASLKQGTLQAAITALTSSIQTARDGAQEAEKLLPKDDYGLYLEKIDKLKKIKSSVERALNRQGATADSKTSPSSTEVQVADFGTIPNFKTNESAFATIESDFTSKKRTPSLLMLQEISDIIDFFENLEMSNYSSAADKYIEDLYSNIKTLYNNVKASTDSKMDGFKATHKDKLTKFNQLVRLPSPLSPQAVTEINTFMADSKTSIDALVGEDNDIEKHFFSDMYKRLQNKLKKAKVSGGDIGLSISYKLLILIVIVGILILLYILFVTDDKPAQTRIVPYNQYVNIYNM